MALSPPIKLHNVDHVHHVVLRQPMRGFPKIWRFTFPNFGDQLEVDHKSEIVPCHWDRYFLLFYF